MFIPTALRTPCSWGDEASVHTTNGLPFLLPPGGSLHNMAVQVRGVCVRACVRACVSVCVHGTIDSPSEAKN